MSQVNFALYNTVTGKILKWGQPEVSGATLEAAYLATIEFCSSQGSEEAIANKQAQLEIYRMDNGQPAESFTIHGAYQKLMADEEAAQVQEAAPPIVVEEEEEESIPDQLIPSSSTGPWYVDTAAEIPNAISINDHEDTLVALVVNNDQTAQYMEQNARLVTKAPELMQLSTQMLADILEKEEGIRTNAEQRFLEGMILLFGGHEIRTEIDILDFNSRQLLMDFVDNNNTLYQSISGIIKHGKTPTEEMKKELYTCLETAMGSQSLVQIHLL